MSPGAARELEAIFDYIAHDSPARAAALIDGILKAIESLGDFPLRNIVAGQERAERPVRSLPVRPYIIYFRVSPANQSIHVLRVVHGARRQPRRF